LISPFQPTVVRGFSKYTRITTSRSPACFSRSAFSLRAYSMAAAGSWIEQGPMITSKRSSSPEMMRRTLLRVVLISDSTGVSAIGKKRIRCSGGGSGVTSRMRWSSVSLVFSDSAKRLSPSRLLPLLDWGLMAMVLNMHECGAEKQKTAGFAGGLLGFALVLLLACA
jgi:hypothetical protein